MATIIERFEEKVEVIPFHSCYEWTGAFNDKGYGEIWNGRGLKAHRVAWEIENGPIPSGMNVCHRCDNRSCVRVSHLFLGTQRDNVRDATRKGRMGGPAMTSEMSVTMNYLRAKWRQS